MQPIKICKKCGGTEFYKSKQDCKACARLRASAYRAANPEKVAACNAAWQKSNPDRCNANTAKWEKVNKDKVRIKNAAWHVANRDKVRAKTQARRLANPEWTRIQTENRRARRNASGGTLSRGLTEKLFKLQKGKCACCQQPLGNDYHLDHIMPLALGGAHVDDNIQLLRQHCNNKKGAKHPIQYMQEKGLLL